MGREKRRSGKFLLWQFPSTSTSYLKKVGQMASFSRRCNSARNVCSRNSIKEGKKRERGKKKTKTETRVAETKDKILLLSLPQTYENDLSCR